MKNTIGLFLALLGFSGFGATYSDPVMVSSNGTLQAPTNFFLVNTGAITAALTASGWSTSSGNANTNTANAWAAGFTQTFLGPVMWGTTNAISEVAGKQGLDSDLTAIAAISGVSGDIIYHNGTNWVRLAKGTDGHALHLSSGFPTWAELDDDNIAFDDADNLWTATQIGPALEELNDSINAGVPNGTGAKVHWSQLLGVPAGFSDGTDDGAGGGSGDVVGPASSTDGNIPVFMGTTGKVLTNSPAIAATNIQTITAAVAAFEPLNANKYQSTNSAITALASNPSLYQSTNSHLTDLADGSLTGSKVGTGITADNITAGTLSSNRLPSAIALTTLDVGTINATAVVGDASGLTGINATNITAGELADARIPAGIARTNAPTLHSPTLLTPSLGVASATSLTLGATNLATALAEKAPLASPAFTGTPTVNSTNLMAAIDGKQATIGAGTSLTTGPLLVTSDFVQNSAPIDSSLGAAVVLNFKFPVSTFVATNNVIVLQSTNRPSATTNVVFSMLRITGDTVDRTISYPASWKRLGTNITTIPSNKVVLVSGMCIGTAESGVTFGVAKEE